MIDVPIVFHVILGATWHDKYAFCFYVILGAISLLSYIKYMKQYAHVNVPIALNVIYVKINITIVLHVLLGALSQNLS